MNGELHELVAPYALDALDLAERESFERHLSACQRCQQELEELSLAAGALFDLTAEPAPARLKERVMADLSPDPGKVSPLRRTRASFINWAIAGVAAAVALIVGFAVLTPPTEAERAEAILASAQSVEVGLDGLDGRVVRSEDEAVFVGSGLTALAGDRTYQLWYIGEEGPVSAGIFRPDATGNATVLLHGTAAEGLVVGLTEEPAGGSDQPTGEVLATAEL